MKLFVRDGVRVAAADISGVEQDTAADGRGVLPVDRDVTKEADVAIIPTDGGRSVQLA